jgi:hypothetical protein
LKWNKSTLIGGALALLGISILLKLLVGVDFPLVRLVFALGFIYLGIRVAVGTLRMGNPKLGSSEFRLTGEIGERESYGVALGTAALDLSEASPPPSGNADVELGVLLGAATVYYSPESPLEISVQSILSDAKLPDGNSVFVGTLAFRTPSAASAAARIRLNLTVCCGNVRFVAGKLPAASPSEAGTS